MAPQGPPARAFHLGVGPEHRGVDGVVLVGLVGRQGRELQDLALGEP